MMRSESEDPDMDNLYEPYNIPQGPPEAPTIKVNSNSEDGAYENVGFSASADDVFVKVPPPKENPSEPIKVDEKKFMYGWCSFKPKFLQKVNKVEMFVFWSVLLCFVEGLAVNGLANAALPHVEKQFGLTSSKSGLITSSQDIGALCVVLFISFAGGYYNKASWVAGGSILMGIGSFLFMVPHMASNAPVLGAPSGVIQSAICDLTNASNSGGPPVSGTSSGLSHFLGVFMVAQMIHGIGFTPMFTLGLVYIEENEKSNKAAIFVGLVNAATGIGVAIGFLVGGQILEKVYVDFDRVDQSSLAFGPRDPQWIGGWWVGFIATSICFIIFALPLFGFPRIIPSEANKQEVENELKKECGERNMISILKDTILDFFKTLLHFLGNIELVFLCLGGTAEILIISGVGAFAFKYLLEQYDLPFDSAGYMLGGLIIFSAFGMVLGGILIRIFNLEGVGMSRLNAVMCVISGLLSLSVLAKCPNVQLAGLEVAYPGESSVGGFPALCQKTCNCSAVVYSPVCGADDTVYFSPCHAGCLQEYNPGPSATYNDCSCVGYNNSQNVSINSTATRGRCDSGCTGVYILVPFLFIMLLATLTTTTPLAMATIRCVKPEHKSFALGFQWMMMRLLGSIPGPVLVGWVLDTACDLWSPVTPQGTMFCLLYNKHRMSMGVFIWWICINLAAALFYFIASLASARKRGSVDLTRKRGKS